MFSAADLANMQECQEDHMMDECKIQACVQTADTYGELVETWPVDGSAIDCGLDMRPGAERHGTEKTILEYDATLRMPQGTVTSARDRIKVTKRYGTAEGVPIVYSIVGVTQKGPSGIRLLLKRIET